MSPTPRRPRWVRMLIRTLISAVVLVVFGNVVVATADDATTLGQTIPTLSWIQLTDAKGIGLWNYELAINFKSDIFEPGTAISAMFTEFLWRGYLGCTAVAIWFLDWVLSFDWLTMLTGPLIAIGDALRDVIARFGLAPVFLMIAGLAGGIFIMRGKTARGVYEIIVGCLIVALSATALSNPIQMVAGPGGWIYQARDHTLELVAAMGDQAHTDQNAITSELITTFVRQPVQLISFGQILDGTACEAAYDDSIRQGPYGYTDDVRNAVKSCNDAAGEYANTPNGGMVSSAFIQAPAGLIVLLIAIMIGGTVMLALVSTVLASLKAIINLVLAVLPGGARRPLAHAFAEMFIGIAVFVFAMFFLGVYLMVIQTVFKANEGQPSKAFAIVIIVMVLGLIAFLRYRKGLKAATSRLTDWMGKRPGTAAPRPLAPAGQGAHWMKAAGVYGAGKVLASPQGRAALKNTAMVGVAALTGNPALAGRVVLNSAAMKRAKGALAGRAATAAQPSATSAGHLAFSGRAAPRTRPAAASSAPTTTSTSRARSHPTDHEVIEGVIVDSTEGPQPTPHRLPMRRVIALSPPPSRPLTVRPTRPRPPLPPGSTHTPKPTRPTAATKSPASGPPHIARRPQHEPPPRTPVNPAMTKTAAAAVPRALRSRPTQRRAR